MAAASKITGLASTHTSDILRAADFVTAMLAATGTRSLDEMYAAARAGDEHVITKLATISLTEEQISLIERLGHHVKLIRATPTANLAECPVCGAITVVTGPVPTRCTLTFGCEGKPEKSGKAKRVPIVA